MKKISKRMKELKKNKLNKIYNIQDALNVIKTTSKIKLKESIDVAINLGINSKKASEIIKGTSQLKYGSGKKIRIAIFAEKEEAKIAKLAGAEIIGMDELAKNINKKIIKFDILLASSKTLHMIKGLNKILGPKGLMPNKKK